MMIHLVPQLVDEDIIITLESVKEEMQILFLMYMNKEVVYMMLGSIYMLWFTILIVVGLDNKKIVRKNSDKYNEEGF